MQYPVSNLVTDGEPVSPLESTSVVWFLQAHADFDLALEGPHPPQDSVVAVLVAKNILVVEREFFLLGEYVKKDRLKVNGDGDVAPERSAQ